MRAHEEQNRDQKYRFGQQEAGRSQRHDDDLREFDDADGARFFVFVGDLTRRRREQEKWQNEYTGRDIDQDLVVGTGRTRQTECNQKRWRRPLVALHACGVAVTAAALIMLASIGPAHSAGLLTPSDGSQPALQIRDHAVKIVIEDGYAITTVEQRFHNPNGKDFATAITEQDGNKTFDISVWPVRAGKDVRIRLSYIQPARLDTGIGRYAYPLEEGGVDDRKLSFLTANDKVSGRFSFDLLLRAAYPVEAVRLPAHPGATIAKTPSGHWRVRIVSGGTPIGSVPPEEGGRQQSTASKPTPAARLDKDIIVLWRQKDGIPGQVELVTHRSAGKERGTFMMVLTPGDDLKPIVKGRDWVFVLDISGSMQRKFQTLVDGVARGLERLTSKDRFRVILFNNIAIEATNGFTPATPPQVNRVISKLRAITPSNGTNLFAGVEAGLRGLDADRTSGLVLVTDGVANVGELRKRAFLKLVSKKDIRLFTLVMGNSANRPLLEAMSKRSGGTAVNVSNSDDIIGTVLSATSKLGHEALHGVKIRIDGVRTTDLAPAVVASLYRGQQLIVFGHYRGEGDATVRLSGKISGKPVTYSTRFTFPKTAMRNPEVERLWAFASLEDLQREIDDFGENPDLTQAATDLAVEYGLVTPRTSMVVVQEKVFVARNIQRRNRDRLKMEAAARQIRMSQPVQARRVDRKAPAFQNAQATYRNSGGRSGGGSGSLDLLSLSLVLVTVAGVLMSLLDIRRGDK